MGSWSVSCGISNIAITAGRESVILPLKENKEHGNYRQYQPATLPIFGEYNDYGGMEAIEENENTRLIAEHFGITIDEFVEFLVDGKFTYERKEVLDIKMKMKNLEEAEKWRFTWIDRKVFDFMITDQDPYHRGYNDYGTPNMLKAFGFAEVDGFKCSNYDPKRFNQLWRNDSGVELYSDGNTLLSKKDQYIYHFGKGDNNSIETYFKIPEELYKLKDLNKAEAWKFMTLGEAREELAWVLSRRMEYDKAGSLYELMQLRMELAAKLGNDVEQRPMKLYQKYYDDLNTYGDSIASLRNLIVNLHPMSSQLLPHVLYLTPQCGEHVKHQLILDKFAEINREIIREMGYDEDEEF